MLFSFYTIGRNFNTGLKFLPLDIIREADYKEKNPVMDTKQGNCFFKQLFSVHLQISIGQDLFLKNIFFLCPLETSEIKNSE